MLTDVDLPAPGLLWTRWATLAAALTGIGYDDVWYVDDRGAHHDDHGGSWARFALLDGARAVLFGYDRDHSGTADADPPIDLLTGAPDWLPWDDLTTLAEADSLGFVVWHAEGRWSRTRYSDAVSDGLVQTVGAVLSNENTLAQLAEIVSEWGRHELHSPSERDDVRAAGEDLLAAAVRGQVTGPAFERLLGRLTEPALDLGAALDCAARGGITAGTRPPRIAAGERPPMRRVRRLSQGEHDRLVWTAMQEAAELDRPAPPATGELEALAAWMRDRSPHGDGRCTVLVYADATSLSAQPGKHPPLERPGEARFASFQELGELVRRLRRAEADPRYGRWFFLRVQTTATDVLVERRYDSWPSWWADDGVSGPWRTNLQEEMTARGLAWRPAWVRLLDPEIAYRPR
ncbi:hypothetical protein Ade02nite_03810 [Paractinoplanes deccanensis]|uniref:Uncharacterized protein n=1 Tax=Paractinoplanes deccanensis TaxID=113561 RepID=A0ABQ3XVH1_9ACTN|nr:hypothetical protein [Actinoplanes deccanensis]GID71740.1 hypothetical protein Ade02nite_03810 [Actinoplanes deccanensis]